MRQAKIDNILYVFDKEPYALTKDTDASVIYVQQESLDGFKLLNPSLTLSPYNYSKFQVTKPVWYDAWEQEEEEGYTPEAVTPQDNIDWNIQMFSNGDRGVGLRLHSEDPTVDADRSDLQAAFESIGASNDDLIDDLVGEYDSDLAITPQALRSRKKNTRTIEEEEMTKVEVHKEGWGQYSFHSDNRMIMSVDYSDTSSDETFIDATGLSSGSDELITFSLINKQPITKRAADLSFYTQSSTVDIYDGTSSVNIDTVSNPNELTPIVYSVDDNDLTVSVNNDNVTISNLKVGTFTITASFAGNDYYLSGSATTQLVVTSVAPKLDPQISWASASVRHNNYENPTVDIQYNNPNNLQVYFDIPLQHDDYGSYVAVDASVTGTYTLTMSYDGDDTYDAASVTCTLTIVYEEPAPQPINYPITINDYNLEVEEGPSLEGTIKNNVTGWAGEAWQNDVMCIVDDNDTMYYTGDLGGLYLENGGALVGKTLTVSITCASDTYAGQEYNAFSDSFSLTITAAKTDPELYFDSHSQTINLADVVDYVYVYYTNTYSVSNVTFSISPSGPTIDDTEDPSYLVLDNLSVGTYTLTLSFAGDSNYDAATDTCTLTVINAIDYPMTIVNNPIYATFDVTPDASGNDDVCRAIKANVTDWQGEDWENDVNIRCIDETNDTMYYTGDIGGVNFGDGYPSVGDTVAVYVTCAADAYAGQDYKNYSDSFDLIIDNLPSYSNYPITIDDYNLEVVEGTDLAQAITSNVTGWEKEDWEEDVMCTVGGNGTTYYNGELYNVNFFDYGEPATGDTVTVSITCASATYGGTTYNAYSDSFTLTIASAPPSYGVSLYNSNIDFDDPDTTSSDIESAIQDNLSGYDPTWMPEPTITVKYGSGDSDFICEDISMSQLDFTNSMDSITYGSTVWTVYYTIAADDHDNEHYPEENLDFTISFIVPTDDYPVTLTSDTIQVEYDAGSSSHVAELKNAIMSNIEDYDDTWMPSIICDIYATDPNTGDDVTITEGYAIGSLDWTQEVQNAFDESGMVVPDQTEWRTTLYIASTTYNGVEYQAWDSGGYITLQFISPVVPFPNYFRLTSNQNGSTVAMIKHNTAPNISLDYTTDEGATWNQWNITSSTPAITLNAGESICIRGVNNRINQTSSNTEYNRFEMTGNISASGNIMSLLYGDNFEGQTAFNSVSTTYIFANLFYNCTALTDVSQLELPATTLSHDCYYGMFTRCTGITKAPYLPASTPAYEAYRQMFDSCSNLNYIKINLSSLNDPSVSYNLNILKFWLLNASATGSLVNENPNFDSTTLPADTSGLPSGWTFYSADPQNYDASINSSNIDIYPSGDIVPYDNISEIVSDIQNNFTCNTVGATASITIPDPNDQGGSNFVIDNIELDNGADLYSAIDNYSQSYGINIGDVWTATIDIPQDTIDGTLYLDWQGTFTISFQDK